MQIKNIFRFTWISIVLIFYFFSSCQPHTKTKATDILPKTESLTSGKDIKNKIDSLKAAFLSDTTNPFFYRYNRLDSAEEALIHIKSVFHPQIGLTFDYYVPYNPHIFSEVIICHDSFKAIIIPLYSSSLGQNIVLYDNDTINPKYTLKTLDLNVNEALMLFRNKKNEYDGGNSLDFKTSFIHALFSGITRISAVIPYPVIREADIEYIRINSEKLCLGDLDKKALKETIAELKREYNHNFRIYYFKERNVVLLVDYSDSGVKLRILNEKNFQYPIIF